MYLTHRMAHLKLPYQWVHEIHHRHDDVSLLSLFVLHPLEVFGFGLLITGFAMVYTMSMSSFIVYLFLNLMYGTLGHLGLDIPKKTIRFFPLNLLSVSLFHGNHHTHVGSNFGFYTSVWDRLFKTYKAWNWKTVLGFSIENRVGAKKSSSQESATLTQCRPRRFHFADESINTTPSRT